METTSEIIFSYEQFFELSQELLIITESLREMTAKKETKHLRPKLSRRKEIINHLKAIENRLLRHSKKHKKLGKIFMMHTRKTAPSLLQEITAVFKTITAYDNEIAECLKTEKQEIAGELKKVSTGRRLLKKYKTSPLRLPNYFSLSI